MSTLIGLALVLADNDWGHHIPPGGGAAGGEG